MNNKSKQGSPTLELLGGAVLGRKPGEDTYRFILRWSLDRDGEQMPYKSDKYRISLKGKGGGLDKLLLQPDGETFRAEDDDDFEPIVVKPRPYAMIEAPRDETGLAVIPKIPVTEVAGETLPDDQGLGILHLLDEFRGESMRNRSRKFIRASLGTAYAALSVRTDSLVERKNVDGWLNDLADEILGFFLGESVRPIDRTGELTRAFQHLSVLSQDLMPDRDVYTGTAMTESKADGIGNRDWGKAEDALFGKRPDSYDQLMAAWERAAIMSQMLRDVGFLRGVDERFHQKRSLAQLMRLRALQGGTVVDYWSNPDEDEPLADVDKCGKLYSMLDLMGLGVEVGDFSQNDLRRWCNDEDEQEFQIHIRLDGHGPNAQSDLIEISRDDIRRALDHGTSRHPPQPESAAVCYDMQTTDFRFRDRPPTEGQQGAVHFETGEHRVMIRIEPPDADRLLHQDSHQVTDPMGYNVYAVWEDYTERTRNLFLGDPPQHMPAIDWLRPWLVTRRYSLKSDLLGAFPDVNHQTHPAIKNALLEPPSHPLLDQRERKMSYWLPGSHERGVAQKHDVLSRGRYVPLEDNTFADDALFRLDLRSGLAKGQEPLFEGVPHWERSEYFGLDWEPDRQRVRDGQDPLSKVPGDQPQRYRFFVTAIDIFGQESDPTPVRTNDVDVGETAPKYLFLPRWRLPLTEPQAPTSGEPLVRGGSRASPELTIRWTTPLFNQWSSESSDAPRRRPPSAHLVSYVRVYRRKLTGKDRRPVALADAISSSGVEGGKSLAEPDPLLRFPQWVNTYDQLAREGFLESPTLRREVPRPDSGDDWSVTIAMGHRDRGFEYRVAVGCRIGASFENFWFPDVDVRTVLITGEPEALANDPRLRRGLQMPMAEKPRASQVFLTPSASLTNPESPRRVELDPSFTSSGDSTGLAKADPILPVPGLSRDAILMKILRHPVDGDTVPDPEGDRWDAGLSKGQREMIDTALLRIGDELGVLDLSPELKATQDADRLGPARSMLAAAFKANQKTDNYRQHETIGFRGLQRLAWTYTPFAKRPGELHESEAVAVSVFRAIAPESSDRVEKQANLYIKVAKLTTKPTPTYRIDDLDSEQASTLRGISNADKPVLVRLESPLSEGPRYFASLASVIWGISEIGIVLSFAGDMPQQLPNEANLSLFLGYEIHDLEIPLLDANGIPVRVDIEQELLVPIPGGPAEAICWWVRSQSVLHKESGNRSDDSGFALRRFAPTTAPDTPTAFSVFPPFLNDEDNEAGHFLDPEEHREWLPDTVETPQGARNASRLVVAWHLDEEGVGIAIERQGQPLKPPAGDQGFKGLVNGVDPWKAIEHVANLGIDENGRLEPIDQQFLNALSATWLVGVAIDRTFARTGLVKSSWFVPPRRGLVAVPGLKKVVSPISDHVLQGPSVDRRYSEKEASAIRTKLGIDTLSGFVDYSAGASAGEGPIFDGSNEYRYRLVAFVDLDPGSAFAKQSSAGWMRDTLKKRYLLSSPTEWSAYETPGAGRTNLDVIQHKPTATASTGRPRVRFVIKAPKGELLNPLEDLPNVWKFRVLVQRKRRAGFRAVRDSKPQLPWQDVGYPVDIQPGESDVVVADDALDRVERDQPLELEYKVIAIQLTIPQEGKPERPIRAETTRMLPEAGEKVRIPAPEIRDGKEMVLTFDVEVSA